jgi:hypothetical protein
MNTDEIRMGQLVYGATSHIIGAAFEVHNTLGYGFSKRSMSGQCKSS